MSVWLDDGDVRLYHGDALEVLAELEDGGVDCVVTSPPYWGLRDYGTGSWEGGDPDCDHLIPGGGSKRGLNSDGHNIKYETSVKAQLESCRKCGAQRTDQQLGLEPTPDQFVAGMVTVFRQVHRVLAPHGTCWVNLGDSYAANTASASPPEATNERGGLRGAPDAWTGRNATPVKHPYKPKDLCGIPWMVAFALRNDGWYLRSDIIWAKPNPMPESVTDRPTKSHEYLFLLTKGPRYFFDQEAVREPHESTRWGGPVAKDTESWKYRNGGELVGTRERDGREFYPSAGRNVRSVWNIATQPYPEAHFATFPEELARRAILAGCPLEVCRVCGKPRERIVERELVPSGKSAARGAVRDANDHRETWGDGHGSYKVETLGWSDCGHNQYRPGTVLDPFIGSGTVAKVARDHGRHAIGIDLNETYLELAARRLQQLSLLT